MNIYTVVLLAIPYGCFVFFSEQLNPLFKPRNVLHRANWRYGRRMALSALVCGGLFLALPSLFLIPTVFAAVIGSILFASLWVLYARKHKQSGSF